MERPDYCLAIRRSEISRRVVRRMKKKVVELVAMLKSLRAL
ncbi:MAG: hypothetical protein QXK71_05650 [Pyrobaculum sp.]